MLPKAAVPQRKWKGEAGSRPTLEKVPMDALPHRAHGLGDTTKPTPSRHNTSLEGPGGSCSIEGDAQMMGEALVKQFMQSSL